ncbi:MAG TPA: hypothetical protein VEA41_00050, partial [Salinarimonas sp.]|nr:hypothetical protein [Salinarimonas sp.]
GGAGERGPWQIREAVWVQHMEGRPFTHARQEKAARECALRHLRWLQGELERRGVAPMPFNLAAAWNAGVGGYTRGQAPVRAYEYASDVENLYRRGRK